MESGIQEIKQKITSIKIKQNNASQKFEDSITQQSEDTIIMKCFCNKLNKNLTNKDK